MFDYGDLIQYVVPQGTVIRCGERRHCFYAVSAEELSEAEKMISMQFPDELKRFYLEVGYGHLGNDNPDFLNQIMHPLEIAKLKLGLDYYGYMF